MNGPLNIKRFYKIGRGVHALPGFLIHLKRSKENEIL